MSDLFFQRMYQELNALFRSLTEDEKKVADSEFEQLTHKDCDEASKSMSSEEFRRAAQEAVRRVREKKKREQGEEMMAAIA